MSDILYDDDKVCIRKINDNGLAVESKISDPAELSVSVDVDKVESNIGKVRFDLRRSDGVHEEYAYIMGRLTADKKGGAIYIATRGPEGDQCVERFYIDHTAAVFSVDSNQSEGPIAGSILKSSNGRLVLACQDDDNFVLYLDGVPIRALFGLPPDQTW